MGAEDGHGIRRYFGEFLDENGALGLQTLDYVFVMDDLMADIDRRPVALESTLYDLDGTHDACAEAARLSQKDFKGTTIKHVVQSP